MLLCYHCTWESREGKCDMTGSAAGETILDELLATWTLGDILLSDEKAFGEMIVEVDSLEIGDHAACRLRAAIAMGDAPDLENYPLLRKALKVDPDAEVRKAVKAAADKHEEVLGEEACLARNEAYTGGVKMPVDSFAAIANGDFYNANLGDFR